ncbi:hypothetical protein BH10BAC4_BH10BAC4_11500 [soil metagenome]
MKNMSSILRVLHCLLICSCSNTNTADNMNTKASFPDSYTFQSSEMKVITTIINRKLGTMSTLYGNSLALQKSRDSDAKMVAGELYKLVTWKQQPDTHWFGANIPGDLQSIEAIQTTSAEDIVTINYQLYEGQNITLHSDTVNRSNRISFILKLKPSILP